MTKILSFVFIASFSPLLPMFFFFLGVKLEYIDVYKIEEFYNVIFVDKISWVLFWSMGIVFAGLFVSPFKKVAGSLLIITTLASFFMFVSTIGHDVSKKLFAKENFHISKAPWTYSGILLYEGRYHYYLLNDENNRTITFKKDEIDEAY